MNPVHMNPDACIKEKPPCARIIGVGGAGSRIVDYLVGTGIHDADFIAIDSFFWETEHQQSVVKIVIGENTEPRPFCSISPEWAKQAAKDDESAIRSALLGAGLVIVLAGMGGGLGSGAVPEVMRISKKAGTTVVAIVSEPFEFEGRTRRSRSKSALPQLMDTADLVVRIPHVRLRKMLKPKQTMEEAFEFSNFVFGQAVRGILCLFNVPEKSMLDGGASHVRHLLGSGGSAYFGFAEADTPVEAMNDASSCPLLGEENLSAAEKLFVSITLSPDTCLDEVENALNMLNDRLPQESELFWVVSETASRSTVTAHVFHLHYRIYA
jgi:cell division protein FtsZ